MIRRLVNAIIALAQRHPYTHLFHADGTCYMRRFWLLPEFFLNPIEEHSGAWELKPWARRLFAFRLHHIVTADYDNHFHDHPWSFVSVILRGGYVESRPQSIEPHFTHAGIEFDYITFREAGSIALRRCVDRHRIIELMPGEETWTLVALGPKRHWWGFYTPAGKIYYADYPSVHNLVARTEHS